MATIKKQNETIDNVKVNESAKVENESNESATTESNDNNNASDNASATKQILIDVTLESATYKIKHANEINKRYKSEEPQAHESDNWQHGKLCAIYRPISDRKNSDKTFYKVEFNGVIFDGYTNTEFCDANGIPRTHRGTNTKKEITTLDKLEALKALLDAININDTDFVNFGKIVVTKIENEKLESDRTAFVAKYAAAIALFAEISEATCAKIYGADVLALAKKLGYKFADTPTDTPNK